MLTSADDSRSGGALGIARTARGLGLSGPARSRGSRHGIDRTLAMNVRRDSTPTHSRRTPQFTGLELEPKPEVFGGWTERSA